MPIKKKKISELTLADSLTGLYTIGCKIIDGIQTSVKVSLGTIQTAYENMLTEISNARAATKAANTAASNANTAKLNAEAATSKANTATANAITATGNANTATGKANTAADLANKAAANANAAHDGLEKIKEEAYQVIENENDGVVSWFIRFSKGKSTVSYSINVDEEELLLTVIENFDMPEEKDIEIRSSSDM